MTAIDDQGNVAHHTEQAAEAPAVAQAELISELIRTAEKVYFLRTDIHGDNFPVFHTALLRMSHALKAIAGQMPPTPPASVNAELLRALKLLMNWTMRDGSRCCCPLGEDEDEPTRPRKMPTQHASGCADARQAIANAERAQAAPVVSVERVIEQEGK